MYKTTFGKFFENDKGTLASVSTKLNLTVEEQQLYDVLRINIWRLEQEKIPSWWVNESSIRNATKDTLKLQNNKSEF